MAGNDWINSYLEAIVDSGPKFEESKKNSSTTPSSSSLLLRERGGFNPTRYFVEEVISGYDETDLYKSWVRVSLNNQTLGTFIKSHGKILVLVSN